ncbi:helix-turn-helix domain-containing protein [Actinokineospora enzanensis]|uniref:helix-turn-helix domain-containing protein n=1 Tax=Actinokineospora enzanensis TaxID=155975 RepID=UPI000374783D|nr:helix-turn-helix transcriptional regulator [Actinokineospora enzanensis]
MHRTRYRRTATRLRALRVDSGLNATTLAERLGWTSSKISHLELGQRRVTADDAARYLHALGVDFDEGRAILDDLDRDAQPHWWWQPQLDMPATWCEAVDLESRADSVTIYAAALIPDLAQTPDYAKAALACQHPTLTEPDLHRRVGLHTSRQLSLLSRASVDITAIIDESALHRRLLDPRQERAQLAYLRTLSPRVTFRVLPLGPPHPGMITGPFTLLTFPHEPTSVHTDGNHPTIEERDRVALYTATADTLRASALTPADSLAFLDSLTVP